MAGDVSTIGGVPAGGDRVLRLVSCGATSNDASSLINALAGASNSVAVRPLTEGMACPQGNLQNLLGADGDERVLTVGQRNFIVNDLLGNPQQMRRLASAASMADLAIVAVDASIGVDSDVRSASVVLSVLGVRQILLCVTEMGTADFSQSVFDGIDADFRAFAASLGIEGLVSIPASLQDGDNLSERSGRMAWHHGPTLLEYLTTCASEGSDAKRALRMPVQEIGDLSVGRGFIGQIASGMVRPGHRVKSLPSGSEGQVERVVASGSDIVEAAAGQSVTLVLSNDVEAAPGDLIAAADAPPEVADQFEAQILWMSPDDMLPGRPYTLKIGGQIAVCTPASPKYKLNVDTLEELAAKKLDEGDIGVCNISLDRDTAFDSFTENRETGSFVLIDRHTDEVAGIGLLNFALRRASNIHRQAMVIDKGARAAQKNQKPAILWFTGLSGSGKSTIADIVSQRLHAVNRHTATLDGDNVRHGLNRDLGFTDVDRVENIRRIAEVSKLMVEAGLIVLTSFISPFRAERQMARSNVAPDEFVEIFIDTPLAEAERRDVKGLYKKARAGEIRNFTGIDSPYEVPRSAEIVIDTTNASAEEAADQIVAWLEKQGYLG